MGNEAFKAALSYAIDRGEINSDPQVDQWVKEQGDGIVLDYDLVKINDHKSHSFYTVSSLEEFAMMLNTEWAREWDKANNCKDIVYKIELV